MFREFISSSIGELEEFVDNNERDCNALRSIENELLHRKTKRAKNLLNKVQKLISKICKSEIIAPPEVRIEFPRTWIKGAHLDRELRNSLNPYSEDCETVEFVFYSETKIILEAGIRILCLANQLSDLGKKVILNFTEGENTLSYLNRMDFFKLLSKKVEVIPFRPQKQIKGKGESLVELGEISAGQNIDYLPIELNKTFRKKAKVQEGTALDFASFTVFGEMIRNVQKHSKSELTGYAALQSYERSREPYIQIVVSDSGEGITNTIRPMLHLFKTKNMDYSELSDGELIKIMFEKGGLSRFGPQKGGTGLNITWQHAMRTHTRIVIRQDNSLVRLSCKYKNGKQVIESRVDDELPFIKGTHITFDFFLD